MLEMPEVARQLPDVENAAVGAYFPDTPSSIEVQLAHMLAQLGPARKLAMWAHLQASARALALAAIRTHHPHADASTLRRHLAKRLLGDELTARITAQITEGHGIMPDAQDDLLAVTHQVADTLTKLGVPVMVVGSLAGALYGMVRTTQDVDLVAVLEPEHIGPLVDALQDAFYLDPGAVLDAVIHRRSFNLIHRDTLFKVDVFVPEPSPFLASQFQRVRSYPLAPDEDIRLPFTSPEDLVLAKLLWYRAGGETSTQQWRDILGVLQVQAGRLDLDYLREWASRLDVAELLDRALAQVG